MRPPRTKPCQRPRVDGRGAISSDSRPYFGTKPRSSAKRSPPTRSGSGRAFAIGRVDCRSVRRCVAAHRVRYAEAMVEPGRASAHRELVWRRSAPAPSPSARRSKETRATSPSRIARLKPALVARSGRCARMPSLGGRAEFEHLASRKVLLKPNRHRGLSAPRSPRAHSFQAPSVGCPRPAVCLQQLAAQNRCRCNSGRRSNLSAGQRRLEDAGVFWPSPLLCASGPRIPCLALDRRLTIFAPGCTNSVKRFGAEPPTGGRQQDGLAVRESAAISAPPPSRRTRQPGGQP